MAKFSIEWGIPEMEKLWKDLTGKADAGTLDGDELKICYAEADSKAERPTEFKTKAGDTSCGLVTFNRQKK